MRARAVALLVATTILAPGVADAGVLTVEGLYGIARPPSADFRAAVSGTVNDRDLSDDSRQIIGGDVLLSLGVFQLGAVIDTTLGSGLKQTAIGGLLGFRFGDKLRLDLLGEAGGHRFGSVLDSTDVVTASSSDQWLFYVGLRPGIAYRFGSGSSGIILGVWGFARWDVTDKDVPVTVGGAGGTGAGTVGLGGSTIGATLRLGFEL